MPDDQAGTLYGAEVVQTDAVGRGETARVGVGEHRLQIPLPAI